MAPQQIKINQQESQYKNNKRIDIGLLQSLKATLKTSTAAQNLIQAHFKKLPCSCFVLDSKRQLSMGWEFQISGVTEEQTPSWTHLMTGISGGSSLQLTWVVRYSLNSCYRTQAFNASKITTCRFYFLCLHFAPTPAVAPSIQTNQTKIRGS